MRIALTPRQQEVLDLVVEKLGRENVFLVGGCVRDALLRKESLDMDFAVRNDPPAVFKAFPYALYYEKFGTVSFRLGPMRVTIASFRRERNYVDYRHPSQVQFVQSLYVDYKRRDFTVNCLYADSALDVKDPTKKGLKDLRKGLLRLIGNPDRRIREDPLRILRALRFSLALSFRLSPRLQGAIERNRGLLRTLNPAKIRQEVDKCPADKRDELIGRLDLGWVFAVRNRK